MARFAKKLSNTKRPQNKTIIPEPPQPPAPQSSVPERELEEKVAPQVGLETPLQTLGSTVHPGPPVSLLAMDLEEGSKPAVLIIDFTQEQ